MDQERYVFIHFIVNMIYNIHAHVYVYTQYIHLQHGSKGFKTHCCIMIEACCTLLGHEIILLIVFNFSIWL